MLFLQLIRMVLKKSHWCKWEFGELYVQKVGLQKPYIKRLIFSLEPPPLPTEYFEHKFGSRNANSRSEEVRVLLTRLEGNASNALEWKQFNLVPFVQKSEFAIKQ